MNKALARTIALACPFCSSSRLAAPEKKISGCSKQTPSRPNAAPTFDTLLAADDYKVYGEMKT